MVRIGIPRALLYYQYYPMWKTFFEGLGAEVITSNPTTRDMLTTGCSRLVEDTCFPVKVFCGHVLSLADKCDYVFIPSIHSVERRVYNCPKFIGLPDLVRAIIPESPPIIDPDINVNWGQRQLYQTIYKLGRLFTRNPLRVRRAAKRATEVHQAYRRQMQREGLTPPQAIERLFPTDGREPEDNGSAPISIALVGHPYLLYDEYINHRLISHLQRMGAKVLFPEMVAEDELNASISSLAGHPYWTYEDEVVGAGGYYLQNEADGVIHLAAFGCGPDSLMVEVLQHRAKEIGKPLLFLTLDQHTADTGLITRLEAFSDMLQRRKTSSYKHIYIGTPERKERREIKALCWPHFGNMPQALRASLQMLNITLISPPVTKRTFTLGTRYSPEFVCLPFKIILGNFMESIELGADTLFMITSDNGCRMGYYAKTMEHILRGLGYEFEMLIYNGSEKDWLTALKWSKRFARNASWRTMLSAGHLAWAKLKALDDLERKAHKLRAIELEKGTTDHLYREATQAIDAAPDLPTLKRVLRESEEKFNQMPTDPEFKPLKVGIIGEPFVMIEPFSNMNLEVELGRLRVEVIRPRSSFYSEWIKPTALFNALNVDKERLRQVTHPYLKRDVGGHALESIGEKVLHAEEYDGFVHIVPFTCMPEVIAQNIMPITSGNIPVLPLMCDEQTGRTGMITRMEAFVDLLERRRRKK